MFLRETFRIEMFRFSKKAVKKAVEKAVLIKVTRDERKTEIRNIEAFRWSSSNHQANERRSGRVRTNII